MRTFIEYKDHFPSTGDLVSIIVRWDPPINPNGILQGYKIRCWYNDNETESEICDGVIRESNQTEYTLTHMEKQQVYFFQVHFSILHVITNNLSVALCLPHTWPPLSPLD